MADKTEEREFDFIVKARQEARKVVAYYQSFLEDVTHVRIPFIELKGVKQLRKIAALDGGERLKRLVASNVIVVRAGGGIFEKTKKIQKKVMHNIFITALTQDIERFSNLLRDILEFRMALRLIEEDPEVLVMDGSLIGYITRGLPHNVIGHLQDRKIDLQPIREYVEAYKTYLKLYDKLLRTCQKKKILLLGVSKDSQVKYLVDKYHVNSILTDYSLLKLKMKKPSVTEPFIVPHKERTELLADFLTEQGYFEDGLDIFYVCYFKLKRDSLPIRVDFPEWQLGRFHEIMEVMETYHDQKGFLMTAHLVHNWAVMKESIVNSAVNVIKEEVLKIAPSIYDAIFKPLRRESI
ncbi:MAG: DNA double-strand break repair nuclease NurA [Candidatus Helarchaeota archaeon]